MTVSYGFNWHQICDTLVDDPALWSRLCIEIQNLALKLQRNHGFLQYFHKPKNLLNNFENDEDEEEEGNHKLVKFHDIDDNSSEQSSCSEIDSESYSISDSDSETEILNRSSPLSRGPKTSKCDLLNCKLHSIPESGILRVSSSTSSESNENLSKNGISRQQSSVSDSNESNKTVSDDCNGYTGSITYNREALPGSQLRSSGRFIPPNEKVSNEGKNKLSECESKFKKCNKSSSNNDLSLNNVSGAAHLPSLLKHMDNNTENKRLSISSKSKSSNSKKSKTSNELRISCHNNRFYNGTLPFKENRSKNNMLIRCPELERDAQIPGCYVDEEEADLSGEVWHTKEDIEIIENGILNNTVSNSVGGTRSNNNNSISGTKTLVTSTSSKTNTSSSSNNKTSSNGSKTLTNNIGN